MKTSNIKLSVSFFPPYDKYYVSANSHIDDYLRNGKIHRLYPQYFSSYEEAEKAKKKWEDENQK